MKLRSESRTVAASETPIAFMLPATHAITVSNASSPLFRLPQELKDRIYHFVYGGLHIHVEDDYNSDHSRIRLAVCKFTKQHNINDCAEEKGLHVASLVTCRQMYHEARSVLYSANTFIISSPRLVNSFIRRLNDTSYDRLAVRSIRLHIYVHVRNDEREWDNTFRFLTENLKNLRYISIDVDLCPYEYFSPMTRQHSPTYAKRLFLRDLVEFKKLPLKKVELVLEGSDIPVDRAREDKYIWTNARKQEWVQSMKSKMLGSG